MQNYIYLIKFLKKNKSIISDKSLNEFKVLKKISLKKHLGLIDISNIENKLIQTKVRFNKFQIKNFAMALAAAKLCNLKEKNFK